ncbi:hypothetical protein [Mycobacterium simiae]|uniref:hypothetical protein n=1 Tax=Mycobacterium simiae TaxID=1784 RepID=UPI0003FA1D52|nr:hypothetical protein [Mycobacterium simiae]PLV55093.1 hypothetical protein X011_00340 [Mycobacterium tuberculosis variant microti OV254]BBX41905.1 hypothetical protein MSIM_33560 [Mycobacterium simiae]
MGDEWSSPSEHIHPGGSPNDAGISCGSANDDSRLSAPAKQIFADAPNAGNHLGKVDSLGWRDDLGDHKRAHGKLLADGQCATWLSHTSTAGLNGGTVC